MGVSVAMSLLFGFSVSDSVNDHAVNDHAVNDHAADDHAAL
jgi:hypothetical protein